MGSCSHGRQAKFLLISENSKSAYQRFSQREFNLIFKSRRFNFTPVFKFYLSFPQCFILSIVIVVPCPGIGFPRKPIHLDICGTDRAHHQLAEMMEINNMQFIQINGCDDNMLMTGANKRSLQCNDDYCYGEVQAIFTDWKLAIKRFTIC